MKNKRHIKPKVVIDTNIFISSWFGENDSCDKILELIEKNKLRLLFSQDSIGELIYVVKKYSIKNMSSKIPRMIVLQKVAELFYESDSIDTRATECPEINDEYDKMFIKCAIEGNADYLVSNDFKSGMHDLQNLKFSIVNSRNFSAIYTNDSEEKTGT